MIYYYRYFVTGLCILCKTPFPVSILEESQEFLSPISGNELEQIEKTADAEVTFSVSAELPDLPEDALRRVDKFYSKTENREDQIHHCLIKNQLPCPYACTIWSRNENGRLQITCFYLPGNEKQFTASQLLLNYIGMETLFIRTGSLMIHAAFIRWNKKGVLFTAPSGTGKSTQADLWKKYEQADILNGDRAAVRKANNRWQAYGLPYAGSSGIYRNEHALLAAVIVLRQAKQNRIRRLNALEVVQNVYPELTIHRWDPDFVEQALTLLTDLSNQVPFYLLECRPDQEAVELVKYQLTGGD